MVAVVTAVENLITPEYVARRTVNGKRCCNCCKCRSKVFTVVTVCFFFLQHSFLFQNLKKVGTYVRIIHLNKFHLENLYIRIQLKHILFKKISNKAVRTLNISKVI